MESLFENIVLSHIVIHEGKVLRVQDNQTHQRNVAELAAHYAKEFGMEDFGKTMGLLHDKGKERSSFQNYIRRANGLEAECPSGEDHNHAFVGGKLALECYGKPYMQLLVNQIISHHSGLHDYSEISSSTDREIPEGVRPGIVREDLKIRCVSPRPKDFNHLSRMLFSCLVDADFLDTEAFMQPDTAKLRGCKTDIPTLCRKLEAYLAQLRLQAKDTRVNRVRNKVQQRCMDMACGEQGFYSLTVPTGGGKTLSSVLWALRHAERHGLKRVIIAIPYTSIIVQTAKTLKGIFGEDSVLEHHSNYDVMEIKGEEQRYRQMLATENWDYPIIVTTNVQLFESMYGNKPSVCRKLHNIVKSVIVLDEVQTLPIDFMEPIVNGLKTYSKLFGVSVLLTTASQPVLSGRIVGCNPTVVLNGLGKVTEIIPEEYNLHDQLRRVNIENFPVPNTYDEMAAMLCQHKKVLCIVNTRRDAKELYERLPQKGLTLHLSRMMCPDHIRETIDNIKRALQEDAVETIRVVATQLVEAGVDMDFPVVFRQEAGLDSVLQAAGRCNREGKLEVCTTYVFSLAAEKPLPSGTIATANNARKNLPKDSDWFAPKVMKDYFRQLYSRTSTFDKKDIAHYLYKPDEMMFKTAAEKFRLIDDNGYGVIVNWKDSLSLVAQLKEKGMSYGLMKKLAQYTVTIRKNDFRELESFGAIEEVLEGIYCITDKAQYDERTGLRTDNHWMEEVIMI